MGDFIFFSSSDSQGRRKSSFTIIWRCVVPCLPHQTNYRHAWTRILMFASRWQLERDLELARGTTEPSHSNDLVATCHSPKATSIWSQAPWNYSQDYREWIVRNTTLHLITAGHHLLSYRSSDCMNESMEKMTLCRTNPAEQHLPYAETCQYRNDERRLESPEKETTR